MCGRFAQYSKIERVVKHYNIQHISSFEKSYNLAPSEMMSVVCLLPDGRRALIPMKWGLVPFWMKKESMGQGFINIRANSIKEKIGFKNAFKLRRCLITADGFFEWQKKKGYKQPYFIRLRNEEPMAFAGLWDRWKGEGRVIESAGIITVEANDLVATLHDRMPAIIKSEDYERWLNPIEDLEFLYTLLKPYHFPRLMSLISFQRGFILQKKHLNTRIITGFDAASEKSFMQVRDLDCFPLFIKDFMQLIKEFYSGEEILETNDMYYIKDELAYSNISKTHSLWITPAELALEFYDEFLRLPDKSLIMAFENDAQNLQKLSEVIDTHLNNITFESLIERQVNEVRSSPVSKL